MQGRKVAFFEVGDLSTRQIIRRFGIRASGRPGKPQLVKYPTYMERSGKGEEVPFNLDFKEREFKRYLSWRQSWIALKEANKKINSKEAPLRLSVHPNSSISVSGIMGILQTWNRQGWSPDVVVIDYADILAPETGYVDSRDQINASWKKMRAMSQKLHCLVVTATQANAASYKSDSLDKSNFSEDKRKYAHVTAMVGINQTAPEKQIGVYRLGWLVLREDYFDEEKHCHVAGCLSIGNPAIRSIF